MKSFFIAIVVSFLFAFAARADMSWEVKTETTVQIGSETKQLPLSSESFAAKANVLRIDTGDKATQFINASNDTALFVSYPDETFFLTDFSQVVATQASEREAMRSRLTQMEAGLAQLPEAERAAQQTMIDAQLRKYELWSRPYTVARTQERREIDGHPCVRYEGRSGNEVFQEIWVAEDIIPDATFRNYLAPRLARLDSQRFSHLVQIHQGFPVLVISHYGAVNVTETMTRYTPAAIPADAFILPANFRETPAASQRRQ